ncbi:MAG: hypothetical protein R3D85_16980 [Paracoccaceae bacterium]
MDSSLTLSGNGHSWAVLPTSTLAGWGLGLLLLYLFVRHFLVVLMVMDLVLGWLRRFRWFPGPGRRRRALVHWLIALALLAAYVLLGSRLGWLSFTPR